jgi:hypothetical protein
MANNFDHTADINQLTVYQIRIKGSLSSQWTEWFDGLTITLAGNGDTLFDGTCRSSCIIWLVKKSARFRNAINFGRLYGICPR